MESVERLREVIRWPIKSDQQIINELIELEYRLEYDLNLPPEKQTIQPYEKYFMECIRVRMNEKFRLLLNNNKLLPRDDAEFGDG